MPDYKAMYVALFNRVTEAVRILEKAQEEGEEAFIQSEDISTVPATTSVGPGFHPRPPTLLIEKGEEF